jgi:hypothetical protein
MSPKKSALSQNTRQILIYVKQDRLTMLNGKCEGRSRNKVLNKLIDGFITGKFEIDWRE